jgi:hypothetical protein
MATTTDVAKSILRARDKVKAQFTNSGWSQTTPLSQIFGAWAPGITAATLFAYMQRVADRISHLTKADLDRENLSTLLLNAVDSFDAMDFSQIAAQHWNQLSNVLLVTQMFDTAISAYPAPPPPPEVDWEQISKEKDLLPKDLARRLRSLEARLRELEPRTSAIATTIQTIEQAREIADQLPIDLEELRERRKQLQDIADEITRVQEDITADSTRVADARNRIEHSEKDIGSRIDRADGQIVAVLKKSEQALRGATSAGLANAFQKRRQSLSVAGTIWVVGLIFALCIALAVGWNRVAALKEVLNGDKSAAVIAANSLLALCGVGAPIWFAWLATRQIGSTFKLAEDYAFKASVAQAYEGYRAEAVEIDPALQARLFASALDRIEEAPIRLLDQHSHNSPLAELLNNPQLRKSLEAVPGIADKILALIPGKGGAGAIIAPASAVAAVAAAAAQGVGEKPAAE